MKFTATILLSGKTATGIEVPEHIVEGLGGGRRAAVNVTINGYRYRSTVAAMGGVFMLPISAEHRAGAGVNAGDSVLVTLTPDAAAPHRQSHCRPARGPRLSCRRGRRSLNELSRRALVADHVSVAQADHPVGARGEVQIVGDDHE